MPKKKTIKEEINLSLLTEAKTPKTIKESILSKLGFAIGGYVVGRALGAKIFGKKKDVDELKDAILNLRGTIDNIKNK